MAIVIFRAGVLVVVPDDYAQQPAHAALVAQLMRQTRYADVVRVLETQPDGWLAADVLTGAPWARRYLNSTARLWMTDRRLAARGWRVLMHILNGTKPHVGRMKKPSLTATELAQAALAFDHWRTEIAAIWPLDPAERAARLAQVVPRHFPLSRAHRRALTALLRRKGLRRADLIVTLVSWETGLAVRRLRQARPMADLVYA